MKGEGIHVALESANRGGHLEARDAAQRDEGRRPDISFAILHKAFVRGALKSAGPECSITRGRDPLETSHNLCDCCFVGLFLSPAVTFCRAALDGCVSFFRFECA
jgi:hypothetical protein